MRWTTATIVVAVVVLVVLVARPVIVFLGTVLAMIGTGP